MFRSSYFYKTERRKLILLITKFLFKIVICLLTCKAWGKKCLKETESLNPLRLCNYLQNSPATICLSRLLFSSLPSSLLISTYSSKPTHIRPPTAKSSLVTPSQSGTNKNTPCNSHVISLHPMVSLRMSWIRILWTGF